MKYIRSFEDGGSSLIYKDGDVVVLDVRKLVNNYPGTMSYIPAALKGFNSVQVIYRDFNHFSDKVINSPDYQPYYFELKGKQWNRLKSDTGEDKFYIRQNEILRRATIEEIEEYKERENVDKYNL